MLFVVAVIAVVVIAAFVVSLLNFRGIVKLGCCLWLETSQIYLLNMLSKMIGKIIIVDAGS